VTPSVAAVIDVGSKSVLLLVVAVDDGCARALDEALATTRLGAGLAPGGMLDPAAKARTLVAVVDFAGRARRAGATRAWAFATGAARDAADGAAFAGAVASAAGIPVAILSGDDEAGLAYAAVRGGLVLGDGPLLVADLGGRTTDLTLGRGDAILGTASVALGALALHEAHGGNLGAIAASVDRVLARTALVADARSLGAPLVASGGTATALAALDLRLRRYDARRVHGHTLAATTLAALPATEGPALDPGRAAILPAGAVVLARLAAAAGASAVTVSDHAVRHGHLRAALAREGVHADFRALWG
jgi:exopolyphosphatase / guanosine-5'-triphosphate,3'-diphosphate pyrophosphatase